MTPRQEKMWQELDKCIDDVERIALTGLNGSERDSHVAAYAIKAVAALLLIRRAEKHALACSEGRLLGTSVADLLTVCPRGFMVSPPTAEQPPVLWRVLDASRSILKLAAKYPIPLESMVYAVAENATEEE